MNVTSPDRQSFRKTVDSWQDRLGGDRFATLLALLRDTARIAEEGIARSEP